MLTLLLALFVRPFRMRRAERRDLVHHAELHAEHMRDLDRVDSALFVLGYWEFGGNTVDNILHALRDFKVTQDHNAYLERQLARAKAKS